jgi:hypothetical protein
VTISGSAAQINAALAGLKYHGNLELHGADTLTVTHVGRHAERLDTVRDHRQRGERRAGESRCRAADRSEDTVLPIAGRRCGRRTARRSARPSTVSNGTLTVVTGGGAVVTGNGGATVTISGTTAEINAALAGLSYLGNLDFNGTDTLIVTTSDGP